MIAFIEENAIAVIIILGVLIAAELFLKTILAMRKTEYSTKSHGKNANDLASISEEARTALGILLDAKTRVPVYVTKNAEELTGIGANSFYADIHALDMILRHDDARTLWEAFEQWDTACPFMKDMPYHSKSQKADCWGRFSAQKAGNGKYISVVFEDRTDVWKREQELQEQLAQAQAVDESKTIFLSKMSHEIRTPMNGMLGMIALAKISASAGNNDEVKDYLDRAESLSQFLLSIINDILDMTRIESGKLELEAASFCIGDMIEKIRSMFETTITGKGIHFCVESDDFSHTTVVGDELRLTQIVSNLLSNSSKFTPADGTITMSFRSMEQRDGKLSLMMRVKDTGKGMSREFLHRLFRPFEQEDSGIARRYGGSGLGMSISDSLVHLMNGQILVDSEEGKGTEFTVFVDLPISKDVAKAAEVQTVEIDLTGRRLLMAEDNAVNTMVAVNLLKHRGFVMETAINGLKCLEMFEGHEAGYYDAILMDIHMPEMDGWEATKRIRALSRPDAATIPIFALSADAFVEDRRHSVAIGMNGHIAKPINYEELEHALKECLAHSEKEQP